MNDGNGVQQSTLFDRDLCVVDYCWMSGKRVSPLVLFLLMLGLSGTLCLFANG